METWVFGAILMLIGFLVIGCSSAHVELGFPFMATGLTLASAGSCICITNFKKWIENI